MSTSRPTHDRSFDETPAREPGAWMVALSSRRIVVVREGRRHGLEAVGERAREAVGEADGEADGETDGFPSGLQAGDPVLYKGNRETVLAVLAY